MPPAATSTEAGLSLGRDSTAAPLLQIDNLKVAAEGKAIIRGIDLVIEPGEIHALMGPNGSGKSTLANALMGNPAYTVSSGGIHFKGEEIGSWTPDARARAGMFMAFQYPEEIAGVSVSQFLRQAMSARSGEDRSVLEARMAMMDWMKRLDMDPSFAGRYLNQGFSGGEKKRNEILQMAVLEPDLAVLDETDSGLDIDALRVVADGIQTIRSQRPQLGVLLVTHYTTILKVLRPDVVHVLVDGELVGSGGPELADRLEESGFDSFRSQT